MRDYVMNEGAGGAVRLGLIVLSTDTTLEHEARSVLQGRDVNLMHSRINFVDAVTPETLRGMAGDMTRTAALLPDRLTGIAYGCTSASTVIGPGEVERLVQAAHPGVPVTNPISAVMAALGALGARRVGMVTPYVAEVVAPMVALLGDNGFDVVREVSFGEGDDTKVARISEASTREALLEAAEAEGVEALFASCTNLQTFGIIEQVEAETGVPVISSNHAMLWHLLKLAGVEAKGWGPGRLYQL